MNHKMTKKILLVDGMTCVSCEQRIERSIMKLNGVTEAKAVYASGKVYVAYDEAVIKETAIIMAIENEDYTVKNNVHTSKNMGMQIEPNQSKWKEFEQFATIGAIILIGYMLIKRTIGFNFIPEISQNMGYGLLFVVGLLTSIHCIAMCGGINLSQCVSYKYDEKDPGKFSKLKPSFMYNSGRVISYTIIGGIVGAIGSVLSFTGAAKSIVVILSGVFMVIMGLNMLNIFPWLRKINPRMPRFFGNKIRSSRTNHGPFYIGLINGLMPCGPLQAMQLYALGTGSFMAGALSMFFFSIGTVPLMFGFGAISSLLSRQFTHKMMRVSAMLVILLGFIMAGRGLNISGISMPFSTVEASSENISKIENNVQYVTTDLSSGRYTPFAVQVGVPVKWTIQAAEGDLNGCNNVITIPEYNIEKSLEVGDNVIEFLPTKEGSITYTCWMGMIRSNISVVSDISKIRGGKTIAQTNDSKLLQSGLPISGSENDQIANDNQAGAGGCCSAGAKATEFANGNIPTKDITIAKIENNQQVVTVTVNDYGYSPAVVVLQKGIEAKIKFNTEQLNVCNDIIVFPEYQAQLDLSIEEQKETPWLVPEQDFTFQCTMNMLHGYVKVVDDLSKVDIDAIKAEVENYTPVTGGGSCCQ